jgi:hypothetical protein
LNRVGISNISLAVLPVGLTYPGTRHPTIYTTQINSQRVLLLDTPGFDDSVVDNLAVLDEIVSNLYFFALQRSHIHVRGVIFLHDISEVRMGASEKKTWSILEAFCGSQSMGHVVVGTTLWSPEGSIKFMKEVKREAEYLRSYWRDIYRTVRLPYNDTLAALSIATSLLEKPPTLLLVQGEMLQPPHTVENTTVGRVAMPEGRAEREKLQKAIDEQQRQQRQLEESFKRQEEENQRRREEEKKQREEQERLHREEKQKWDEIFRHEQERRRQEEERRRQEHEERQRREEEVRKERERLEKQLEQVNIALDRLRKPPKLKWWQKILRFLFG